MTTPSGFPPFAPGFEFLQSLVKNAGAVLPGMGQWVAPTLEPEELDKRIQELRTVQFWLEKNTQMLAATVQALEVQRMTLATLKTMNVHMDDLRQSMHIPAPVAATSPGSTSPSAPGDANLAAPLQWWNNLAEQFVSLAQGATNKETVATNNKPKATGEAPAPVANAPTAAPAGKKVARKKALKTAGKP
jgi:hypothetical protein